MSSHRTTSKNRASGEVSIRRSSRLSQGNAGQGSEQSSQLEDSGQSSKKTKMKSLKSPQGPKRHKAATSNELESLLKDATSDGSTGNLNRSDDGDDDSLEEFNHKRKEHPASSSFDSRSSSPKKLKFDLGSRANGSDADYEGERKGDGEDAASSGSEIRIESIKVTVNGVNGAETEENDKTPVQTPVVGTPTTTPPASPRADDSRDTFQHLEVPTKEIQRKLNRLSTIRSKAVATALHQTVFESSKKVHNNELGFGLINSNTESVSSSTTTHPIKPRNFSRAVTYRAQYVTNTLQRSMPSRSPSLDNSVETLNLMPNKPPSHHVSAASKLQQSVGHWYQSSRLHRIQERIPLRTDVFLFSVAASLFSLMLFLFWLGSALSNSGTIQEKKELDQQRADSISAIIAFTTFLIFIAIGVISNILLYNLNEIWREKLDNKVRKWLQKLDTKNYNTLNALAFDYFVQYQNAETMVNSDSTPKILAVVFSIITLVCNSVFIFTKDVSLVFGSNKYMLVAVLMVDVLFLVQFYLASSLTHVMQDQTENLFLLEVQWLSLVQDSPEEAKKYRYCLQIIRSYIQNMEKGFSISGFVVPSKQYFLSFLGIIVGGILPFLSAKLLTSLCYCEGPNCDDGVISGLCDWINL